MKKNNLAGFNFVRLISAIGIVAFHYSCHLDAVNKPLYKIGGIGWGDIFVTVFFMLSGSLLYYNHNHIDNLKIFYYKRWKSIFPLFYLVFSICYISSVIVHGSLFYKGNPFYLLFSLGGVDGYFLYLFPNYYQVGEWFLGAIVLLYALYPLLLCFLKKNKLLLLIFSFICVCLVDNTHIFLINPFRNLLTCMFSFILGMLFLEMQLHKSKKLWISLPIGIVIYFFSLHFSSIFLSILMGGVCFCISLQIGILIKERNIISTLSQATYAVFLVHHIIILYCLTLLQPQNAFSIYSYMIIILLFIFSISFLLNKWMSKIMRSQTFIKIENRLLSVHFNVI